MASLLRTAPTMVLTRRQRTLAGFRARVEAVALELDRRVVERLVPIVPYVNEGRWVADCPNCGAGMAIHPEWAEAGCLECASWYPVIQIRADWVAVELALVVRPMRNQNARSDETPERLQAENEAHRDEILAAGGRP